MPVLAMSLECVASAPHILKVCNYFQMGRINASAVPAEMIEFETKRDLTNQPFVSSAMS